MGGMQQPAGLGPPGSAPGMGPPPAQMSVSQQMAQLAQQQQQQQQQQPPPQGQQQAGGHQQAAPQQHAADAGGGGTQAGASGDKTVWTEHTDKNSGRTYYYNKLTRQSVWTKPPEMVRGIRLDAIRCNMRYSVLDAIRCNMRYSEKKQEMVCGTRLDAIGYVKKK